MQIELSQMEMCKAVEYWLSKAVLLHAIKVIKMSETKVNEFSRFRIEVDESKTEKPSGEPSPPQKANG